MNERFRRILGLDPGLQKTGWGIIEASSSSLKYIAHGTIQTTSNSDLDLRLQKLFKEITDIVQHFSPDTAAIEETFLNQNPATTLKLGLARGVVMVAPVACGVRVGEYSANHIKKTVVGAGHADKEQVKVMIKYLLPRCPSVTSDEADALAVAICHAHTLQTQERWKIPA